MLIKLKNISVPMCYISMLIFVLSIPNAPAHAQQTVKPGYASVGFSPNPVVVGQPVHITINGRCAIGSGNPEVSVNAIYPPYVPGDNYYQNIIDAPLDYINNAVTWTPTQVGNYYISAYISPNGAYCPGLDPHIEYELLEVVAAPS